MGIGSGDNGEITFLDAIAIVSFLVGLENLDLNVTQDTIDKQTNDLQEKLQVAIQDIHNHLQNQDRKIDAILQWVGIGELTNDS